MATWRRGDAAALTALTAVTALAALTALTAAAAHGESEYSLGFKYIEETSV